MKGISAAGAGTVATTSGDDGALGGGIDGQGPGDGAGVSVEGGDESLCRCFIMSKKKCQGL